MTQIETRQPLVMRWRELPRRAIRATKEGPVAWFMPNACAVNGHAADGPFDFGVAVQRLIADIAVRCVEFQHIDVSRILVTVAQARGSGRHGLQARVTPLRFANGAMTRQRRGVPYHIQRYFLGDVEFLYVMTFLLPRFLEQDFDAKLVTLFHELYHIGPAFDGDLRRHAGRYHHHSHCKRNYDEAMVHHARQYLASRPNPSFHAFLRLNFAQLEARHGSIVGVVVPRPKMIPLFSPQAPK
ncbi:MAG: hypothetical protein FJ303_19625 [Planctomycetes bacterium]|nr:hypothetical protein [Planctomycetota bacterium]